MVEIIVANSRVLLRARYETMKLLLNGTALHLLVIDDNKYRLKQEE
jgi:hypothetical protein